MKLGNNLSGTFVRRANRSEEQVYQAVTLCLVLRVTAYWEATPWQEGRRLLQQELVERRGYETR